METYPIVPPLPDYESQVTTGGGGVTTTTGGGSTTKRELSPAQLEQNEREAKLLADQTAQTEAEHQQRLAEAKVRADFASQAADIARKGHEQHLAALRPAEPTPPTEEEKAKYAASGLVNEDGTPVTAPSTPAVPNDTDRVEAARARYETARQRYENAPAPSFFRNKDTWGNVMRGVALALGTVGDAIVKGAAVRVGQAPPSINTVGQIINRDFDEQRERIGQLKDQVVQAYTGVQDAQQARAEMLAQLDLKQSFALDNATKLAEQRLASLGLQRNEIDKNAAVLALRAEAEKVRRKAVDATYVDTTEKGAERRTETKAPETRITNRVPQTSTRGVGAEDIKNVNQLENDIKKLDRTIALMEKDPQAAEQWRNNEETWLRRQPLRQSGVGKAATAVGLMNVAPEQGLTSPVAKEIHQGMAQAKTSIAKGYGGVITDSDRESAASEMATLANTPAEQIASLKRTRDMLRGNLDNYLVNRGVKTPAELTGPAPTAPTPSSAPPAPGAAAPPVRAQPAAPAPRARPAAHAPTQPPPFVPTAGPPPEVIEQARRAIRDPNAPIEVKRRAAAALRGLGMGP